MEETRLRTKVLAIKGTIILLLVSLFICSGSIYGLWRLIKPLTLDEVRMWAIVSTLLVPSAALAGFLFGRREANVLADGMRVGVNEVTRAADEVTTFKDKAASRSRMPPVTVQVAALPNPQVFHRQLEGESDRVDL